MGYELNCNRSFRALPHPALLISRNPEPDLFRQPLDANPPPVPLQQLELQPPAASRPRPR